MKKFGKRFGTVIFLSFIVLSQTACQNSHSQEENQKSTHIAETPAATSSATFNESQRAYEAVNVEMHKGMAAIDADPDAAFMEGMIAHHKGAVAMSEVALKYGKDAKVRDLANRIIKAQAGEIAEMEAWLKEKGKAAAHQNSTPVANGSDRTEETSSHAAH
mgnify:CR=1 FL=1